MPTTLDRYRLLGRSALRVSPLCLGTMTWGEQNSESEAHAQIDGGSLEPGDVDKYVAPLVVPPAMPRAGKVKSAALAERLTRVPPFSVRAPVVA